MQEPDILIRNRNSLAFLLMEAAEIEHGLMCTYLYAAFSLKQSTDEGLSEAELEAVRRWHRVIIEVAREEMLHLAIVSNLLSAIGWPPHFSRGNFPVAPGYHPAGVTVFLSPFDRATLDHFIFLERPEGMDLPDGAGFASKRTYERGPGVLKDRMSPSAQDYLTVGHLYRGIRNGFEYLAQSLGEERLFCGDPEAGIDASLALLPGLERVRDLEGAQRSIERIVEQGEGAPGHDEDSHYRRFCAVRDEYEELLRKRPDFYPARPVARNPVMNRPPIPDGKIHVAEPHAARLLDLGNCVYNLMLRLLGRGFESAHDPIAGRRLLFEAAIETMMLLTRISERLTLLPANPETHPGVNAGLSFAVPRSQAVVLSGAEAWQLFAEQARELGEACEKAEADFLGGQSQEADVRELDTISHRLLSLADRFAAYARRHPAAHANSDASDAKPHTSGASGAVRADAQDKQKSLPKSKKKKKKLPDIAEGEALSLSFDGNRCIHARFCVLGAPKVFLANVKGPWLHPDAASVEALTGIAHSCPSGAITYKRKDGGPDELPPPVNLIRLRENGPLAVHAEIALRHSDSPDESSSANSADERDEERPEDADLLRATLCRCGASQNKPYCDGAHYKIEFRASGEPATEESDPLDPRDGALEIAPQPDGPLLLSGPVEICAGTGRTIARTTGARLCRCGGSQNKPFCDGTHRTNGFRAP